MNTKMRLFSKDCTSFFYCISWQ